MIITKDDKMAKSTKATATKSLNKVLNWNGEESREFAMWHSLPRRIKNNWITKCAVDGTNDFVGAIKAKFEKMNNSDYITFIIQN